MYSYSFNNVRRDLKDIFNTIVKDEPRFIRNFSSITPTVGKHSWKEDVAEPRCILATVLNDGKLQINDSTVIRIKEGTLLVDLQSGSTLSVVRTEDSIVYVSPAEYATSRPIPEGSINKFLVVPGTAEMTTNETEDENFFQDYVKYNVVSGALLCKPSYGSADNAINRNTATVLSNLARDINICALHGIRQESYDKKSTGGLYFFHHKGCGTVIDAGGTNISDGIIQRALDCVSGNGFEPTQIVCNVRQAKELTKVYENRIQILRSDERRGAYVASVVDELNGKSLTIIVEPDLPYSECWVLDPTGFGMAIEKCVDIDDYAHGFDGIRRRVDATIALEFRNAGQRCVRIKNLGE
jgi:hypothetical protein